MQNNKLGKPTEVKHIIKNYQGEENLTSTWLLQLQIIRDVESTNICGGVRGGSGIDVFEGSRTNIYLTKLPSSYKAIDNLITK